MNILEAGHSLALAGERVDEAIQMKRNQKAAMLQEFAALIDASETHTQRLQNAMKAATQRHDDDIAELQAIKGGEEKPADA